jgi:hypothetical protein
MKLFKSTISLVLLLAIVLLSSCKKCKVDNTSTNTGAIIEDVVIYPSSGFMTGNMAGNYVIDANSVYADKYQMAYNSGDRMTINYNNFTLLAFPVTARCNASFERNVDIDNTTQTVTYSITVNQCSNCKEERATENYVLVPVFPTNYTVVNKLNIIDKE